ncbi:MAG TPA: hypothetical protein VIL88_11770 [Devosia sp.]|jgi:hypothetical protein|uniref:SPW repeat domain-containing protein n=1 Tax=Devosia sp. TaxID=1871048 RepID=UPI002F94F165
MIPTRIHGIIDYLVAVILILAPFLLGFADGSAAQWTPILVGITTIFVSLFTRYELGVVRVVPMAAHLAIDIATGILLLASPWLFGFADRIWWPHVLFGLLYIVTPLLTQRRSPQDLARS